MKTPRTKGGHANGGAPLDGAEPPTTTRRPRVKRATTEQALTPIEPPPTEVARLAHELFLSRGGAHGHDLEDWLEAERQMRSSDLS
jgi:Protein of unknown function (DUF2934)